MKSFAERFVEIRENGGYRGKVQVSLQIRASPETPACLQ